MDFTEKLNNTILDFASVNKIVVKEKDCCLECVSSDEITKCQEACVFGAIVINPSDSTVFVDEAKCIDCGFCLEVCPNQCFVDKTKFDLKKIV